MIPLDVMPLRYSADVPAMVHFLTSLGLTRSITAGKDAFAVLKAGSGRVMVHDVSGADANPGAGDTVLCLFSSRPADSVVDALAEVGLEAVVWDESYGRQAMVTGPMGDAIWINEAQDDVYGYDAHDDDPDQSLVVTTVRPTDTRDEDRQLFTSLGFTPDPGATQWWEGLRSAGGVIGLHAPEPHWQPVLEAADPRHRLPLIHLGFETSGELETLRDRLLAAGYRATIERDTAGTSVGVVDPDGVTVTIHPVPTAR